MRTQIGEKVKAQIGIEFSLFLYSFPFFLVLNCRDSIKMYSVLIMD